MKAQLAGLNVVPLGVNAPLGDRPDDFGLAALPGREAEFARHFEASLDYAAAIGGTSIHCMAGVAPADDARCQEAFAGNLREAADKAARASIFLLIEPINHYDKPGYFLRHIEQAAEIIERAGRSNIKIMFDLYHVQIMQGDLLRRFEAHRPLIGHVQFAAVPDRGEPDRGEIDIGEICRFIDKTGYTGWIGAEYRPRGRTEDGLGWLKAWTRADPERRRP